MTSQWRTINEHKKKIYQSQIVLLKFTQENTHIVPRIGRPEKKVYLGIVFCNILNNLSEHIYALI